MKITDVKTTLLFKPLKKMISNASRNIPGRDIILIEVFTDEGVTGTGFLTGMGAGMQSEAKVINYCINETVKPMVVGKDPLAREQLWNYVFKNSTRFGRKGAVIRALSGVDIALWDLAGQYLKVPCYKLLGYDKTEIPVYASGGYYAGAGENDLGGLVEEVKSYVEKGYKALKIKVGRLSVKDDIRRVEKIRDAIGFDFDLMADANEAWNLRKAIQFCDGVKDLDLRWVEEPLEPDDLVSFKELSERTNIPIAAGESEYTKYGFQDLIRHGVRVLNADATRMGGITEWMKTAAMAQCRNLDIIPHCVQEIHVTTCACAHNSPFAEYFLPEHPQQQFISELFIGMKEGLTVETGCIRPLELPGLGLIYDPEIVKHYKVG